MTNSSVCCLDLNPIKHLSDVQPSPIHGGSTLQLKVPKESAAYMLVKDTTAHQVVCVVHAYWIKAILEAQGAKHVIRQVVLMADLCIPLLLNMVLCL